MSPAQFNNRHVDRWVSWVNRNRPQIALAGEPKVRRIVTRALDDSSVVRFWLTMCAAFAGAFAGYHVATMAIDPSFNRWQGGLALVAFTGLLSLATGRFTNVLIVRKIDSLADGTRYE